MWISPSVMGNVPPSGSHVTVPVSTPMWRSSSRKSWKSAMRAWTVNWIGVLPSRPATSPATGSVTPRAAKPDIVSSNTKVTLLRRPMFPPVWLAYWW